MWWDKRSNKIYFADNKEITDFASTPIGDGHTKGFRGSGRLHDQTGKRTQVLVPNKKLSKARLIALAADCRDENRVPTLDEVMGAGYHTDYQRIGIWGAGRIYSRMLRSSGINMFRAALQRAGLRTVGAQYVYRWAWNNNPWEYAGSREE